MSAPGQIIPLRPLIIMSVFAFIVLGFQASLYSEEFAPAQPEVAIGGGKWWGSWIPIIGPIGDALIMVFGAVAGFFTFLWNLMTFNIPEIPDVIRGFLVIINVIFVVVIALFVMEIILKVASIVRG